ncbi:transposase [Pelagicoccus sp. SDUM812003]|uniref:transposase n=1 Tax=Pelagicoccus sp. SDUM812003 TaxID=3041267 RepID=UPI00280ED039|nr:transposase [Pelagicoccus sp. SDUM812003]MDQ8203360.1 transposase [Pelagicoccus sp. SDUM812003]
MARPLRFEYPGAIYHVINRGNYRFWIFEDVKTRDAFEKCLFEACEQFGWVLHAYCVMSNHYHLALETLEPNLSAGMRWLQSTFAMRYNRYRKEHGHLFQGRFKSIVVEDTDRLAWLCHYIHLNPVRAGIVTLGRLQTYSNSSYAWLMKGKRGRPNCLRFSDMLDSVGGLKDGPVGRRKYADYLKWLATDEPKRKEMLFERMSRGWAMGTKAFKTALLEDGKREVARRVIEGKADAEARDLIWSGRLEACLAIAGKTFKDAEREAKSMEWKVAICAYMREAWGCKVIWLSERLNMGAAAGVSRCLRRLREGELREARQLLECLKRELGKS